jgi:tetratricopeptide (TPR) repeat protein/TolB-like protein/DNA-binding winged helix-turn-helix (wHTH) protein
LSDDLLQGFYLGERLVEPVTGRVTGRAGSKHLPPKAAEVLLCLARAPGELVTHETLLRTVWGAGQGSHEALSHAVTEVRHALEDHANNPVFVQTLPKRGYRLIVDPILVTDHDASTITGANEGKHPAEPDLIEDLKRRGVFETALAYMVVGWLLIQVADIVFSQLHFPEWAGTFATALVIAGFPFAIALSWFLEFQDGRAVVDEGSATQSRRHRFSRTYVSIIGALAIAAVLVYIYDQSIGLPQAAPSAVATVTRSEQLPPIVENSFAVLPFLNLDGSDETQIFADGLVDDVISQLSRVPGLRVASRGDSFSLTPNSSSQNVRDRLRVEMYLEGSVEMAADAMRVTVQMIDAENGFHILSRTFDRPRADFFDVRDEITSITVANVRVALPPGLRTSSLKVFDDSTLDAYVLYRRGIQASRQPRSVDTISSALGWFDAALEVDPEYAAAHAGKCAVYVDGYSEVQDAGYIAQAESACATALALNPNLDIVHTALGDLYRSTGQWNNAEVAYQKALAIDPSNVESLTGLGTIYMRQQRFDEAEASLRKAVDIHPGHSRAYNRLGNFLFRTGRFTEAAEQFEYVVGLEHNNMNGYANLGGAYTLVGNFAAAAIAYEKAIEIEPTQHAYSNLGMMQYYLGDTEAAIDSHMKAVGLQPNGHLAHSNLGDALWAAGREDEARGEFEKADALAMGALQVNPNDPLVMMDLAWIRTSLAEHAEAMSLIKRAIELAPEDPYAHYIYGLMLNRRGDSQEALDAFESAVELGYSTALLAGDPNIANLRSDTRFNEILNLSE